MKRLTCITFAFFLLCGCATKNKVTEVSVPYQPTPELAKYYADWQSISNDPAKLTSRQQAWLKEFDEKKPTAFCQSDWQFISLFPWIDAEKLTVRDKLFLFQLGESFATAAGVADIN